MSSSSLRHALGKTTTMLQRRCCPSWASASAPIGGATISIKAQTTTAGITTITATPPTARLFTSIIAAVPPTTGSFSEGTVADRCRRILRRHERHAILLQRLPPRATAIASFHRSLSTSDGSGGRRGGKGEQGDDDGKVGNMSSSSSSSSSDGRAGDAGDDANNTTAATNSGMMMAHTDEDITSSPIENTDKYDPRVIMNDFADTSYYYYQPPDLNLVERYSTMTNQELMDTSTIPGWDYLIHSPPVTDNTRLPKGALVGTVVSTKMQKTVNVAVDRYRVHPKYRKRIRYTRKFMAHDENEVARDGDTVLIVPSQRLSKHKHFMLREIVRPKGQL